MPRSAQPARPDDHLWQRLRAADGWVRLAILLVLLATILQSPVQVALSQVRPGATLTVLSGSVAVTRSDGTAIYPAGTGLTLAIGDLVATLERTQVVVTFFSGSEVVLGSNTTILIRRLDRDLLDQANVTVEHVTGAMLIRVPTESGPNPGVQVLGNGTVAVIRAGEVGHGVDPTSNNVTVACVDGEWRCSHDAVTFPNATTFLPGQTALTVTGAGNLIPFRVARSASIWSVLAEGAGLDQKEGTEGNRGNRGAEEDDDKPVRPPTPTPTGTVTQAPTATMTPTVTPPPGTPGPACGDRRDSPGIAGAVTTVHDVGRTSGTLRLNWVPFTGPDRFDIVYEGTLLFSTGLTDRPGTDAVPFSGSSSFVSVVVTTGSGDTDWSYTLVCLSR